MLICSGWICNPVTEPSDLQSGRSGSYLLQTPGPQLCPITFERGRTWGKECPTKHVAIGQAAPNFELTDVQGRTVRLSDYKYTKNVVLAFTWGFI